jgi:hypothetical protein
MYLKRLDRTCACLEHNPLNLSWFDLCRRRSSCCFFLSSGLMAFLALVGQWLLLRISATKQLKP